MTEKKYVAAEALVKFLSDTGRTPEEKMMVLLARLNGGALTEQDCVAMRGTGAFQRTRSRLRQKRECLTAYRDYNNLQLEPEVCADIAPVEVKCEKCPKPAKRSKASGTKKKSGGDGDSPSEGEQVLHVDPLGTA